MSQSFDDVFSGKEPKAAVEAEKPEPKQEEPAPEPKAEAKPEGEPKPDKPRDESGKFVKGEKQEAEPPAAKPSKDAAKPDPEHAESEPLDPKAKAYYAKAKDEQRKRQELEQRLAQSEARFAALNPPKIPDVLADPEGYARHQEETIRSVQWQTILDTSENAARDKFGDEVVTEAQQMFKSAAQANPALWKELEQQRQHPYKWVVGWAKREKFNRKLGDDPDAYIESLVAERLAKRDAEAPPKIDIPRQPIPPPSLASASSGGRTPAPAADPKSFTDIFRR